MSGVGVKVSICGALEHARASDEAVGARVGTLVKVRARVRLRFRLGLGLGLGLG